MVVDRENMRTRAQLSLVGSISGMMGIGWASGDANSHLENYQPKLSYGNMRAATPPAFSRGSDINGFEEMPKPRQDSKVEYCADSDDDAARACRQDHPNWMRLYSFGTKADGNPRTWNYNEEGVAQIGLYPDIYQDLKNLGMTENERAAFFGAAEALRPHVGQD